MSTPPQREHSKVTAFAETFQVRPHSLQTTGTFAAAGRVVFSMFLILLQPL